MDAQVMEEKDIPERVRKDRPKKPNLATVFFYGSRD